jgi:hypothetical protein
MYTQLSVCDISVQATLNRLWCLFIVKVFYQEHSYILSSTFRHGDVHTDHKWQA